MLTGHARYWLVLVVVFVDTSAGVLYRSGSSGAMKAVVPQPQLADAAPLCRELKARHPELIVIWGGYFPTQHYDVCLKSGYVDYVVRGHGEVVFQSLGLLRLEQGSAP